MSQTSAASTESSEPARAPRTKQTARRSKPFSSDRRPTDPLYKQEYSTPVNHSSPEYFMVPIRWKSTPLATTKVGRVRRPRRWFRNSSAPARSSQRRIRNLFIGLERMVHVPRRRIHSHPGTSRQFHVGIIRLRDVLRYDASRRTALVILVQEDLVHVARAQ